jgi:hypothetical protein
MKPRITQIETMQNNAGHMHHALRKRKSVYTARIATKLSALLFENLEFSSTFDHFIALHLFLDIFSLKIQNNAIR